jgi:hypothetical protein
MYSICSAKNLDLEIFTLIQAVESVARTISNLSRLSLKLLFDSIKKSSKFYGCFNIFHILDKLRHEVLKNFRNQAILIPMSKRFHSHFPIAMGKNYT